MPSTDSIRLDDLSIILLRDGKTRPGPRVGPGRAGPEDPGPRGLRAETGINEFNDFLYKIPLCIVRWPLCSNKGIMYCCNL